MAVPGSIDIIVTEMPCLMTSLVLSRTAVQLFATACRFSAYHNLTGSPRPDTACLHEEDGCRVCIRYCSVSSTFAVLLQTRTATCCTLMAGRP